MSADSHICSIHAIAYRDRCPRCSRTVHHFTHLDPIPGADDMVCDPPPYYTAAELDQIAQHLQQADPEVEGDAPWLVWVVGLVGVLAGLSIGLLWGWLA